MRITLFVATAIGVLGSTNLAANDQARPPLSQQIKVLPIGNPARDKMDGTIRGLERKQIFDMPNRMLQLATPPLWSNPSRDIAKNYAPSALAVERVRGNIAKPCSTFYDRVDLKLVRARGFRLVGYNVEPLTPRYGHVLESPVEGIAVQTSKGDVYTANLQDADQIRVRPPMFVKKDGNLNTCWSGYRLSITLEGPKGVEPFGFDRGGGPRPKR